MTTPISQSRKVNRESTATITAAGKKRTIIVELDPNIPQNKPPLEKMKGDPEA